MDAMTQRVTKSALGSSLIAVAVLAALALPYAVFHASAGSYIIGGIAGIPSGFLISVAIYWMTGPSLNVSIAPSKYDKVSDGYWIHLIVRNDSWNVLGSGTARECVGKVKFFGMRRLAVSWRSRPNPVRELPVPVPGGATILYKFADPVLYEQKRTNTIRPDDPDEDLNWLDIVWRPKDRQEAYVSIPEHFQQGGIALFQDLKLGVGEHPFSVEFEFAGGTSSKFYFALVNRGGTEMTTESLFIRPITPVEQLALEKESKI
jgi:hypothetical protein